MLIKSFCIQINYFIYSPFTPSVQYGPQTYNMLSYSMCLCPLILSGHFSQINYSLASKNYQAAGISLGDFTQFGYFALKIRFECCYLLCILEHRKHCTTIVCWSGMAGDILGKERERRLMVHLGNKEVVFYWLFNASANSSGYMANKRLIVIIQLTQPKSFSRF